jgi:hypothetical protein
MNEVAKVLNDAADLIEQRGWAKRAGARDSTGTLVAPLDPYACRWCATGAIERAAGGFSLMAPALVALRRHLGLRGFGGVPGWNDRQPNARPVIAALRAAAKELG